MAHDVVTPGGEVRKDPHVFEFSARRVDADYRPLNDTDQPPQSVVQAEPSVFVLPAEQQLHPIANAKPIRAEVLTAASVMKQLRARLKEVEREIRVRRSLEEERDQIKRLLRAAKENKSTVTPLRRAAG